MRGEKDRRWKLGQEVIGQIEIEVEAGQVAPFLLLDFVDVELRKEHAPFGVMRMRQRLEAAGEEVLFANIGRLHGGELVPSYPLWQSRPRSDLHCLATEHLGVSRGFVGQVVASR